MSYSLIINSKNRIAPAGSPNDATYYFDWAAFQEGKYRVTWSIFRTPFMGEQVQATPIAGNLFTAYTKTVTNVSTLQNGTYVATASSYAGDYPPHLAFNGQTSPTFYHSQYQAGGGTPGFTQTAYLNGGYRGGGSDAVFFTTPSSTITATGEWLQIKLPYSLRLTRYTILQRAIEGRFLASFVVMGSNDGAAWVVVDSQPAVPVVLANTFAPATMSAPYQYFRIVFTALQTHVNGIAINLVSVDFSGLGAR